MVVLKHFLSEHCSRCVYTLSNYVCDEKNKINTNSKPIFFFTKPIMVKCLNIGKNIGQPIYRLISLPLPALRCTVDVRDGSAQFVL